MDLYLKPNTTSTTSMAGSSISSNSILTPMSDNLTFPRNTRRPSNISRNSMPRISSASRTSRVSQTQRSDSAIVEVEPAPLVPEHMTIITAMIITSVESYSPINSDEIQVSINDQIRLIHLFNDGWCLGTNLSQDTTGIFPKDCLPVDLNLNQHLQSPATPSSMHLNTPLKMIQVELEEVVVQRNSRTKKLIILVCFVALALVCGFGLNYGQVVS